eukprot:TRINITY_DN47214_c0_g2_i3.p1 TRINITY_DN47214_c0_g2~~TRINITY_DN47214_c0_g2_i3.p1  ORF type:complete len:66 (+),score=5.13 TRINITY_DN47214_c0_g2_i3:47-244(+)
MNVSCKYNNIQKKKSPLNQFLEVRDTKKYFDSADYFTTGENASPHPFMLSNKNENKIEKKNSKQN